MDIRRRTTRRPATRAKRGFAVGLTIGLVFGVAAMAHSDDADRAWIKSIFYTIGALAVDTETNAERIEALSHRIDDLEIALKALSQPKR